MATKKRNPGSTPDGTPPQRRTDTRPTLTVKGPEFSAELRALMNRAAATAGLTQSAFVARAIQAEAVRVLKGEPEAAAGPPPAIIAEEMQARLQGLEERVAGLAAALDKPLWRRLIGR